MNIWSCVVVCNAITPYWTIIRIGSCDINDGCFSFSASISRPSSVEGALDDSGMVPNKSEGEVSGRGESLAKSSC